MLIRNKRSWEIPESQATPEDVFSQQAPLPQRALAAGIGLAALARSGGLQRQMPSPARMTPPPISTPFPGDPAFTLDRAITDESVASNYNNFYEFGSSKRVAAAAQSLRYAPGSIMIDGLVEGARAALTSTG